MEDNIYLDKVIEFLVRDTKIDYEQKRIQYPFFLSFSFSFLSFHFFSKYCKVTYGLTEQEIEYVWDQYKDIILDKIKNER